MTTQSQIYLLAFSNIDQTTHQLLLLLMVCDSCEVTGAGWCSLCVIAYCDMGNFVSNCVSVSCGCAVLSLVELL